MNPQFTSRLNEDTTKKLLANDKARDSKAKAHHSGGGGGREHASVQVDECSRPAATSSTRSIAPSELATWWTWPSARQLRTGHRELERGAMRGAT